MDDIQLAFQVPYISSIEWYTLRFMAATLTDNNAAC